MESVAWASERKDTLSAFFGLLTFLSYLRYSEARSMVRLGLVALTLACGLMAKSMLVTWPFLLLLLDFWPLRRLQLNDAVRWKERIAALWPLLREKLPLFGLVLASVVMTMVSQKSGGAFEAFSEAPLSVRLSNAIVSYAKYIGAIFWPTHLAAYYYFPTHGLPAAHVIAALLLLIALTAGLFLARSRPYLIVGWLWFLGTLVPVIGVVQVGGQAMADHYTYLPSIGLFVAVVFGVADLAAVWQLTRAPLAGAAAVVLLAASCVTARQLGYWRDSETLFRHTLANTSENPPIEYNLGCVLARSGRHEEALPHFDKLLHADPDSHAALLSKGAALSDLGRTREAGEHFQRAIKRVPHSVQARTQYVLLLAKQGEGEQALVHFRHASDLAPRDASARTNLGVMLTRLDRMIEAEGELIEAVRLNPKNAEAHSGLGFALLESGRPGESIPAFLTALRLKPDLSSAQQNLERAHAMLASSK
ncbi:MAG: tetratricopeptide repeat protein [Chthoniobacterales bacterium]